MDDAGFASLRVFPDAPRDRLRGLTAREERDDRASGDVVAGASVVVVSTGAAEVVLGVALSSPSPEHAAAISAPARTTTSRRAARLARTRISIPPDNGSVGRFVDHHHYFIEGLPVEVGYLHAGKRVTDREHHKGSLVLGSPRTRVRKAMGDGVWVRVASPMLCSAATKSPAAIPQLSFT